MSVTPSQDQTKATLRIATDFSPTPGGRLRKDGPHSGEEFREDVLIPALRQHSIVEVDLSGTIGYGSSFLEEAFGGAVRQYLRDLPNLDKRVVFIPETSIYAKEAREYMTDALKITSE